MDIALGVVALIQPICAGLVFWGPFAPQDQVHVVGPAASNVGSAEIQLLNPDGSPRVRAGTGADFSLRNDDAFATALARVGDLDLDGIAELAVGLPNAEHLGRQEVGEVRILFLDATPTMEPMPLNVGQSVREQLERDLGLEQGAVRTYNESIRVCRDAGDNTSRELFERLLKDEEGHVDWLESQLHLIKEMGYERYLSQQLEGEGE